MASSKGRNHSKTTMNITIEMEDGTVYSGTLAAQPKAEAADPKEEAAEPEAEEKE
jgi:hypothetical protein